MKSRIDYASAAPGAVEAMHALEQYVSETELETSLIELVKIRASQLNGCAYCIDMHTKDARAAAETEQRIYALTAWTETPFYTERECAALDWAEAVTLLASGPVTDETYERARQHFTDKELVDLTIAIIAINGWNRLAVPFHTIPGTYKPEQGA